MNGRRSASGGVDRGRNSAVVYNGRGGWEWVDLSAPKRKRKARTWAFPGPRVVKRLATAGLLLFLSLQAFQYVEADNAAFQSRLRSQRRAAAARKAAQAERQRVEEPPGIERVFRVARRSSTVALNAVSDILALAPETYKAISFVLKSGEIIEATESAFSRLAEIVTIRIDVESDSWDAMAATVRVTLLNNTHRLLRQKLPRIVRNLQLVFDDDRIPVNLEVD